MSIETKGVIFIIFFEVLYGISGVAIKGISRQFPSALLVFINLFLAAVILLPFVFLIKKYKKEALSLSWKQIRGIAAMGIASSGLAPLLYVIAVKNIGVALGTLIANLEIPLLILFAYIFFHEKLTKGFLWIAGLIVVGFYLLTFTNHVQVAFGSPFFVGVVAALLAAATWAFATILGKFLLRKENLSPVVLTFYRHIFGSAFNVLIAFFVVGNIVTPFQKLLISDWVRIIFLALTVPGVAYVMFYYALHKVSVKKISLLFVLGPAISVFAGVSIGEKLTVEQWIGTVVIICGLSFLMLTENS